MYFSYSRHRSYPIDPQTKGAEKITLHSDKGKKIIAWYKSMDRKKIVVVVHGHFDNAGMMFERYTSIFTSNNWDVLAIDLRNHGLSDDEKPITYGSLESFDVVSAINWINERRKWEKVVVFGTSMGSVASLIAVANTKYNIDGIILDSPFVSIEKSFKLNLKKHHIPEILYYKPLYHYIEMRYKIHGFSFDYFPDIIKEVTKVILKTKLLVARGTADTEVSIDDFELIKSVTPKSTHLEIAGMSHSRLYQSDVFVDKLGLWLNSF